MNEVEKLRSHLLEAHEVAYYFTTRHFGFSKAPFKSLNFGFHVGDDKNNVIANHELLASHLKYRFTDLTYMNQVHSNHVKVIHAHDTTPMPLTCDGLITHVKHKPLMVMSADCTPVLLFNKRTKTIAALHVGRAGALQNIVKEALLQLEGNKKDIIAVLGPSIHQCCYEVGQEVVKEVEKLNYNFSIKSFEKKYYLDVNAIIMQQLLSEGIKKENIEVLNHCTSCNNDAFFSYRKEKKTGRMAAVIMLL